MIRECDKRVACRDAVRRGGVAIAWVEQTRGEGYGRMRCGLIVTEDVIVFSAIT